MTEQILAEHILTYHWKDSRTIRQELIAYRMSQKWPFTPAWWIEMSVMGSIYVHLESLVESGDAEMHAVPRPADELDRLKQRFPNHAFVGEKMEWRLKPGGRRQRVPGSHELAPVRIRTI